MPGPAIGLLRQLLAGPTGREAERTIIDLLAKVDAAQLNEMLADPPLTDRLLDAVDDRWFGPDNHSELVELLGVTRRAELDIPARAALIHALQTGRTCRRDEEVVRDLFIEVTGHDLTVLKSLIDATPNHNDLEELVYGDIDDDQIRGEILAHIAAQGAEITDLEAKVLSDIDDTTLCMLHDKRFPKGIVYPGVLALWEALDQGPNAKPRSVGDLTFITARPEDLFGLVEDMTRSKLRAAGVGASSMLTGSLTHLLSHGSMADKKIANLTHYHALYPEYRLVFIGDSGQGDVEVGQRMLTDFAGAVDAVLIHDVVDTPAAKRAEYRELGVLFFDTYVGAAVEVHKLGLISDEGLQAVAEATRAGFDQLKWANPEQEQRARALLQADLDAMAADPADPEPLVADAAAGTPPVSVPGGTA